MTTRIAQHLTPTRLAAALAAGLLLASPAGWGAVTVVGRVFMEPYAPGPFGPGDIDLPDRRLWLAENASFAATAGSKVNVGQLFMSYGGVTSSASIDGEGTLLSLNGDGNGSRLEVGNAGVASLTVSGGATLDGRASAAACLLGPRYCSAFIGNAVGSTGSFTVTDSGSSASFLGGFYVGGLGGLNQGFGTPGGVTRGTVSVLNGGVLRTDYATVGGMNTNAYSTGGERSFANVVIEGAGSMWQVSGGTLDSGGGSFTLAYGPRTNADVMIRNGGQLSLEAAAGRYYDVRVGNGGDASLTVSGVGSRVSVNGDTDRGGLNIAEGGGTGLMQVQAGGTLVSTARWTTLGLNGGNGRFIVTGANSTASFGGAGVLNVGGDGGVGRLEVLQDGAVATPQLNVGRYVGSSGTATIDGANSRVTLSQVAGERLYIGNGALTVSGGGLLDARVNAAACDGGVWCAALVGAYAGANAKLVVTGVGSTARFLGSFQAGIAGLGVQALDGYTVGTPGEAVVASVQVLNGGLIQADRFAAGLGNFSVGSTGLESSLTNVLISGAGSTMQLTGGNNGAVFQTVIWNAKNATVNVNINDGGQLQLQAPRGMGATMSLSNLPGNTVFRVSGAGSAVEFSSDVGSLLSVANNGGTAVMSFSDGAHLRGVSGLQVGSNGGQGVLSFDGAGTAGQMTGYISSAVGRRGQGTLNISNGATLVTDASTTAAFFSVGQGNATARGSGTLNISGAGSALRLQVADNASSYANPAMFVGLNGDGIVNISGGGSLLLQGGVPPTSEVFQTTGLTIGSGNTNTANGTVNVGGSGSKIEVRGVNAFITVGAGPLATGRLNIRDGALVQTTLMGIADNGATGTTRLDNATLRLSGQWQGSSQPLGASLSVGAGVGSVGALTLDHGAQLRIENAGLASTALGLGGYGDSPQGTGVLNVANGSRIDVSSASGQGQVFIGHSGTGVATFSSGSALTADYVGVGAVLGSDGGVGTLIVNQSTITATTIEIGARGYVGGNGTLVGHIINRGVFSPGNSPGTLVIDGSFVNAAGGRLVLEVETDGHGGFNTDHLIFAAGTAVDLSGLQVSFRFLGNTDPTAFQASGLFDVDSFFQQRSGTGVDADLSHALFQSVRFSATANAYAVSNFSFTAEGGAVFTAAAVPEPSTWLMLLAGMAGLMCIARRRRHRGE